MIPFVSCASSVILSIQIVNWPPNCAAAMLAYCSCKREEAAVGLDDSRVRRVLSFETHKSERGCVRVCVCSCV